jgi:hypothetical protein
MVTGRAHTVPSFLERSPALQTPVSPQRRCLALLPWWSSVRSREVLAAVCVVKPRGERCCVDGADPARPATRWAAFECRSGGWTSRCGGVHASRTAVTRWFARTGAASAVRGGYPACGSSCTPSGLWARAECARDVAHPLGPVTGCRDASSLPRASVETCWGEGLAVGPG